MANARTNSKWLTVAALLLAAGWAAAAPAPRSVAVYSGSFDPPTRAHVQVARRALRTPGVRKLYLLVNTDGPKDFKASVTERKAMLEKVLDDKRVTVVPVMQATKNATVARLGAKHRLPVHQFLGQDSFEKLPEGPAANLLTVVARPGQAKGQTLPPGAHLLELKSLTGISSTQIRQAIADGKDAGRALPRPVAGYIEKQHLYRPVPSYLRPLQEALFAEGFQAFATDVGRRLPRGALAGAPPPAFDPTQSQRGWADKLARWLDGQAPEVAPARRQALAARTLYFKDGTVRLPFLEPVTASHPSPRSGVRAITRLAAGPRSAGDVGNLPAEGFPKALQSFVREHDVPIFAHTAPPSKFVAFHARQGFTEAYRLEGRVNENGFYLLRNPKTGRFRLALSEANDEQRLSGRPRIR